MNKLKKIQNFDFFLKKQPKKQRKKKGKWNYYFEDLISIADILYSKCLENVSREDKESDDEIKRMHYERSKRTWRNYVREKRKTQVLFQTETTQDAMCERKYEEECHAPKFVTISSYDYKVKIFFE